MSSAEQELCTAAGSDRHQDAEASQDTSCPEQPYMRPLAAALLSGEVSSAAEGDQAVEEPSLDAEALRAEAALDAEAQQRQSHRFIQLLDTL